MGEDNFEKSAREDARRILERFAEKLDKVKQVEIEEEDEEESVRQEKGVEEVNNRFRERFFKNAPKKEGDLILAEKKKW